MNQAGRVSETKKGRGVFSEILAFGLQSTKINFSVKRSRSIRKIQTRQHHDPNKKIKTNTFALSKMSWCYSFDVQDAPKPTNQEPARRQSTTFLHSLRVL